MQRAPPRNTERAPRVLAMLYATSSAACFSSTLWRVVSGRARAYHAPPWRGPHCEICSSIVAMVSRTRLTCATPHGG